MQGNTTWHKIQGRMVEFTPVVSKYSTRKFNRGNLIFGITIKWERQRNDYYEIKVRKT